MLNRRSAKRIVIGVVLAAVFGVVAWLSLRHHAAQGELAAFQSRRSVLEAALRDRAPQLTRATALQPNFKQLTQTVTTERCKEILGLVRKRYAIDPFDLVAARSAPGLPDQFRLDPCGSEQVFAEPQEATVELDRAAFALQWIRHQRQPSTESTVTTLWLSAEWELLEMQVLTYALDKLEARPEAVMVRVLDSDGSLIERSEDPTGVRARVVTADGAISALRRRDEGDSIWEHVDVRKLPAGTKVHMLATAGAWYELPSGLSAVAPRDAELKVWTLHGRSLCKYYADRPDEPEPRTWAVGPECGRRRLHSTITQ